MIEERCLLIVCVLFTERKRMKEKEIQVLKDAVADPRRRTFFFCSTNVCLAKTDVCDHSKRTFTERSVDSFQL